MKTLKDLLDFAQQHNLSHETPLMISGKSVFGTVIDFDQTEWWSNASDSDKDHFICLRTQIGSTHTTEVD